MIAYFDCFSGISGDMTLGALIDAGAPAGVLTDAIERLGLNDEVRVITRHEQRGHLGGTRVTVDIASKVSRTLPQLREVVAAADLPPVVRSRALDAIERIGCAESRIHGVAVDDLHLHALDGADTLVDLVGAFWLLHELGVDDVYASSLPAPRGWLGEMPLPAPASLEVLAGTGATFEPVAGGEELVTPTGAAILAAVARFERPSVQLERVGYGIGARDRPGNGLAVWLGQAVHERGNVTVIETNIDDMPPNLIASLAEDLLAAGALDVTVTPVVMKKGRPGHVVNVLAEPSDTQRLARLILQRSTTLGVRMHRAQRVLADRRIIEVETELGRARVKVKEIAGEVVDFSPEYDDCRRLASLNGHDVPRVMTLVAEAARQQLRLS